MRGWQKIPTRLRKSINSKGPYLQLTQELIIKPGVGGEIIAWGLEELPRPY